MIRRADRRASIGLQLAALVDLLFVITFLLICDRESLLQKRLKQYKRKEQVAEQERKDAEQQATKLAQEAIERAANAPAASDPTKSKDVGELQRQLSLSREREIKLEKELHSLFNFILTGMRKSNPGQPPAPVERVGGPVTVASPAPIASAVASAPPAPERPAASASPK